MSEHIAEKDAGCTCPRNLGNPADYVPCPSHDEIEQDAPELLARLRDEVIAVVAEGLWDGDSDSGHPDYDRIAVLYDEAASNVIPSREKGRADA